MRARAAAFAILAVLIAAAPARAEPPAGGAREAYERGAASFKKGDFALAASEFARADELSPSPTALEAALDAAVAADDAAIGAELLERSKRAPASGSLAESIAAARARFAGRGGFVRVPCPNAPCKVTLDGKEISPEKPAWATKGPHGVVREDATGARTALVVDVKPDTTVDAQATEPAQKEATEAGGTRLPPFVFWIGVGATAVAGAATLAFALDANGTHDDFERASCDGGTRNVSACMRLRDDGEGAETRANVALITTLIFGAGTALLGLYFTDWGASRTSRTSATVAGILRMRAITF